MFPGIANVRIAYYKRYRMEIALADAPPVPQLPPGFTWLPWEESLRESHAEVTFRSFQNEIDAYVFPSLGNPVGCSQLMREIRTKSGFLAEATWLLSAPDGPCGAIQGRRDRSGLGAIQNVGVVAAYRGLGLGTALVLKALEGFFRAGLGRAFLEVTARNDRAVQLYHRLGMRRRKTVYKAVDTLAESYT